MKYYFLLILSVLFISCADDSDSISYQTEDDIIQYLEENNINAERSETGLYYVINKQGVGNVPTDYSNITVNYKGYLLDGSVFGNSVAEGNRVNLTQVIEGWAEGLKYFNEGGEGTLFIPPSLAFGDSELNGIPSGSVLIFDIEILEVEEPEDLILQYIVENSLDALNSESGLYYVIDVEGEGDDIYNDSYVTVNYKGYFLEGEIFDESAETGASFSLDQVIEGWTEGLTYFNKGGEGMLLIPPHLGYGYQDRNGIPAGSVLIFDIKVLNVQ